MAKFLIADDHPLFREALAGAITPQFNDAQIVQSDSLDSTVDAIKQHSDISLVLFDLNMPGCEHFYGLMKLSQDFPDLPVVVVSASDSPQIVSQVMRFGAKGFIPKSAASADMAAAINTILGGEEWLPEGMAEQLGSVSHDLVSAAEKISELTPKQFQVLKLLQDGMLNKQIAYDLNVTEATVKAHISAIFRKLDVNTRTQAVLLADKLQLD